MKLNRARAKEIMEMIATLIGEFERKHPEITVEFELL